METMLAQELGYCDRRAIAMAIKRSLIELVHDEGYGDDLVKHINIALRGKDMRAERVVATTIGPVEIAESTKPLPAIVLVLSQDASAT